jgi:hypothetical protein
MKRITVIIISAMMLLGLAAAVMATPRVLTYPLTLNKLTDNMTVTWDNGSGGAVASAAIIYGTLPMNYTGAPITQSASNICNFTPGSPAVGMTGGVYYCRISDNADGSWSNEFILYVDTATVVQQTYPVNQAVNSLAPDFAWQALNGVPYYTILVFDAQPDIQTGSNGTTVTANVIWGAITNLTSITYRETDPSGYYTSLNPPPLMQGQTYAWAVIKNYNGTPSIMSSDIVSYKLFTVLPAASCSAPVLILPADGDTKTAGATINLSWQAAAGANSYKVVVRKVETGGIQFSGDLRVPVWSAVTNSTNIDMPQNLALNTNTYDWYVIALDASGRGMKSAEWFFNYVDPSDISIELDFVNGASGVPSVVVYLQTATGGQVDAFPFVSDDSGKFFYNVPAGNYTVFAKKEGYDDKTFNITAGAAPVILQMSPSLYTITGSVTDGTNPVLGASVLATENGTTFTASANTAADGSFTLGAGSSNADWTIQVSKPGYQPGQRTVTVPAGPPYNYPVSGAIVITKNLNTLSGTVSNNLAQGINGAQVTVSESGNPSNVFTMMTGFTGGYTILLPDGTWLINVTASGFVPPPQSSATLSLGGSAVRDFTMQPAADQIDGYVKDNLNNVMQNVLVRAVPVPSGAPVDAYTDNLGHYVLSVGVGNYNVNAILANYGSNGPITANFAAGGLTQSNTNFILTANGVAFDANFHVYIDDGSVLLPGVQIFISGNDPATTGCTAFAFTDATGNTQISNMKPGGYNVTLSKTGYTTQNLTTTLVAASTVNSSYSMFANPAKGKISGTVIDSAANPVQGATVEIYDQSNQGVILFTGTTNAAGQYDSGLVLNYAVYGVKAFKDGYSSAPPTDVVTLSSASATANFTLTQASGGGIVVIPPDNLIVYNENIGGPYDFGKNSGYFDGSGSKVQCTLTWRLEPAVAGTITGAGVMTPTLDYLGDMAVVAESLGFAGRLTVPVWQKLTASPVHPAAPKTVQDYAGFSLAIPPGAAAQSNSIDRITMSKSPAAGGMAKVGDSRVSGLIYSLTDGFEYAVPATLTLPLSNNIDNDTASIARWNKFTLQWDKLGGTKSGSSISVDIAGNSGFAVVTQVKGLGLDMVHLSPNPFSPTRTGLNISYSPQSNTGNSLQVTIKIYNMDGKYVATVTDGAMRSSGVIATDHWNGKDKTGQMSKNGRYILQFELKDAGGTKQYLYTVVLIK